MKRHKLTCPSCAARFVVSISPTTAAVACPECDRQFKLKRRTSKSPSAPATRANDQATAEERPAPQVNEFLDQYDSDIDSYDEYEDFADSLSDELPAAALPPRRSKKNSRKKKQQAARSVVSAALEGPRRSLDDLSSGTYDKKQYFSEAGSSAIKSMLLRIGVIVVLVIIVGYLGNQFRDAGLVDKNEVANERMSKTDILLAAYDYYSDNDEKPVMPGAGPTLEEVVQTFLAPVHVTPMPRDSGPQTVWRFREDAQTEQWSLAADEGTSIVELAELSKSIRLLPIGISGQMAEVRGPAVDAPPFLLDLRTMQGRQLNGVRLPKSSTTTKSGDLGVYVSDYSPNVELIAMLLTKTRYEYLRHSPSRVSMRTFRKRFVTVNEYDNTLLKVFPDAEAARFVSDQRVLIASPVPVPDQDAEVPLKRSDACRAQSLAFWNKGDDKTSDEIAVPLGGHWTLSPARRHLVVVQPDDGTTKRMVDNPEEPFNYACGAVIVRVFDTINGQQVANGEFAQQSVGRAAVFSHDGRRLALHGAGRFLVLNMANGTVVAHGRLAGGAPKGAAFNWLAGTNYLRVGETVVSIRDGMLITGGWLKDDANIRVPAICLADHYVRDSSDGVFVNFPESRLNALRERMNKPAVDKMRQTAVLEFQGTDSQVIQGCVKGVLQQRLGVDFVDEASPESVLLQVTYSENSNGRKHKLDRWRDVDPLKRLIKGKRDQPEEQKEIEVCLELKCLAADGSVLDSTKVRKAGAPISLDFSLPLDMQFRVASLVSAASELNVVLDLPEAKTFDPKMQDALWSGESLPDASEPLGVTPATIPIDNAWIDDVHGLPI